MRKTLLVVVLALSGCGKKGSEANVDCSAAVTKATNLAAEEFKKNGVTDATQQKIREGSTALCTSDKWSNEIKKCFVDATTSDAVTKCQQTMTKPQNDNLASLITGAMAAQPEGSGSSVPPPPEAGSDAGSGSATVTTGLPPECADYKAMIEKLVACDKLPPASRDMLTKSFADSSKQWSSFEKLPADAKTALTNGCKQGAEALKKAAGPTCGF